MDRRRVLVNSEDLPDRTCGAALVADISGFTPLTEALVTELGPRRGADELSSQLNAVYGALIAEVHHYGGSVIGFSGDAITCWFDGDNARVATTCALAMQQIMSQFSVITTASGSIAHLAMKAAVACGPVRRFRVGSPQIQFIDVLAGTTLDQTAMAESCARRGEVILSPAAAAQLSSQAHVAEWRSGGPTAHNPEPARFAILSGLTNCAEAPPCQPPPSGKWSTGKAG